MSICDLVVPYKPLDSFFLFCFTVGDLPKVDVCGSVHPSTIHKEKSNKMQQCIRVLCLTTSTNYMSNNLLCMKNQRLPVQF